MKERVCSGAVLLLFLVAVIVFNNSFSFALNLVVSLISAISVYELVKAVGLQHRYVIVLPSLATAVLVPLISPVGSEASHDLLFVILSVYTGLSFLALLGLHGEVDFKDIAVAYSMVVMVPSALSVLVSLRRISKDHGMFYVLLAMMAAWTADVGAYFAGTLFGKHPLSPKISPKKTVEGYVGGVAADILVMLLFGVLFERLVEGGGSVNYWVLGLLGFAGAQISVLGDLSFSLIKRSCHIKDFGQMIPGHGGVLDRFDSVIFCAPFVYIIVSYFPVI